MKVYGLVCTNIKFPLPHLPPFTGLSQLPDYGKIIFDDVPPIPLNTLLPKASPEALTLLQKFFAYHPPDRISATQVLHRYSD